MINIVNDLLLLSELEKNNKSGTDKKEKINFEKINIIELIEKIFMIFEKRIKEKKLDLNLKINNKIKYLKGDSYKLEQMFINLIDNAVKYTEKGEIKVILSELNNEKIKIEIIDTGIGIPEKDINRLFERFYVVDKSRSRLKGGTGLGLSIVKHIIVLHQGEIKISSQLEKGTAVTITLPKEI